MPAGPPPAMQHRVRITPESLNGLAGLGRFRCANPTGDLPVVIRLSPPDLVAADNADGRVTWARDRGEVPDVTHDRHRSRHHHLDDVHRIASAPACGFGMRKPLHFPRISVVRLPGIPAFEIGCPDPGRSLQSSRLAAATQSASAARMAATAVAESLEA
jgi:hypothetical protein